MFLCVASASCIFCSVPAFTRGKTPAITVIAGARRGSKDIRTPGPLEDVDLIWSSPVVSETRGFPCGSRVPGSSLLTNVPVQLRSVTVD